MTLNDSQWERFSELVEQLQGLAPSDRDAALQNMRGKSEENADVLSMLALHFQLPQETDARSRAEMTWSKGGEPVQGYILVKWLGGGGFGEVWQAQKKGFGKLVALKIVRLQDSAKACLELRALELLKQVRHPHLLAINDAWHTNDQLILDMELADRSLQDRLEEVRSQGLSGIPVDELLLYMADAAEAIDYLNAPRHHIEGREKAVAIQHRDVKPANLLLQGGRLKVGDFGLAKALGDSDVSHTGAMSPPYASPEAFQGEAKPESDQYSLAVTYYELRTGHHVFVDFQRSRAEIMRAHLTICPNLSALPTAEAEVVAQALKKNHVERWPTCCSFVNALRKSIPFPNENSAEVSSDSRSDIPQSAATTAATTQAPLSSKLDLYSTLPAVLRTDVCKAEAFIETWTRGFVGRDFVIDALDRFLMDPQNPSGYFVIRGEPGIGKSAFMAHLVASRGYVHHFNSLEGGSRRFVRNVCAQIIGRFSLPYQTMPVEVDKNPGDFLETILAEASRKLIEGQRLVVVIDAIDEVRDPAVGEPNILFLPLALDKGVFFIVTTRPTYSCRLQAGHLTEFDFESDDKTKANEKDAEKFIRGWLPDSGVQDWMRREACTPDEFIRKMIDSSESNFMYLHHMLRAIAKPHSAVHKFRLHELPRGLLQFYQGHWEQMHKEKADFKSVCEPVVCVLAAAEEAVTVELVAYITGQDQQRVRSVLRDWWEFLYVETRSNGEEWYRVYHKSFNEFLEKEVGAFKRYYDMIADAAAKALGIPMAASSPVTPTG